jgi:carbohydrate kinase (thermoresistant glucokinase family)
VAALVLVVMGVSGSGKTTVGVALARRLGWPFEEGDELHPAANIARMANGQPLTDADRAPWLDAVAAWIENRLDAGGAGVIACSALKRAYRDRLAAGREGQVRFVYLKGGFDLIALRLKGRRGHFMPPSLLASQFADLEAPAPEEAAVIVHISEPAGVQVDRIIQALGLAGTRADR